jgi:hypothetical protein
MLPTPRRANRERLRTFTALFCLIFITSLFLGCTSHYGQNFRKRTDEIESFTLQTLGGPGQHFTATLDLDGVAREISGITPAEFPLQACVLSGTVRKTKGDGVLQFRVLSENATLTFGKLEEPGDSRRFRYHARGIEVWN